MTRRKVWLATGGTLLLFVLIAALAAVLLHPHGRDWILLAGVLLLGIAAAVLVYYFLSARVPETESSAAPDDPVDAAAAAARARLAAVGAPGRLPGVLILGPPGSAKSTVVTESGLNPELVAGEAPRGVPTPSTTNVWYAQGTVLVEAGGVLLDEPARWQKLMRHFRPRRLGAALLGRAQAPRLALVCFPCDELVRAGAAQSAPAAAQALRTRLLETARQFGVRLPVYVLFTRTDRIPHFAEYVRSLSREEAQEVLGATLPALPPVAAALHAEREAQRVATAFDALVRSLALRRSQLLPREAEEVVRATAYEFPRELRKAADAAVQFLVELTRPSHLGISPFLRGFYFTGVRPIVVDDGASAAPSVAARPEGAMAATGVFDARAMQAATAQAAAPRAGRRVPEWVFLRRLFPEVILADRAAAGATARGSRVDALRRFALGAAVLACLVLVAGFTVSFFGNRRLEGDALQAARDVPVPDAAAAGSASTDALHRLDGLRSQAALLRGYILDGAPLHLRWGLYTGSALLPSARAIYFRGLYPLLWRGTRENLVASLRSLPPAAEGTAAYVPLHDALRAHLVTTNHPEASTGSFLAPVLLRFWTDPAPAPDRTELARRQFEFFGNELPFGNPYNDAPDAAVPAAQAYLRQFGDSARLYAALLTDAGQHASEIRFGVLYPHAAPFVRDTVVVPGAFTRQGWAYVQGRLRNVNQLFDSEPWVLGAPPIPPQDRARLARALATRYAAEYVERWQAFLRGGTVGGFGDAAQAAAALQRLSNPQSPLLQLLSLASTNTAVDTAVVAKAFQPVRQVVPAGATDRLLADAGKPYLQALASLQGAVQKASTGPAAQRAAAAPDISNAAGQVNDAVQQLSQTFIIGDAGEQVRRLLSLPALGVTGLAAALPAEAVKGKGGQFCQQIAPSLARYPFNPRSDTPATLEDVGRLFLPGKNAFTNVAAALPELLVQEGTGYAAKLDASPQPSPAFIHMLNRAGEI
ncbi:MAG TPA: ImcF-related family protein, partial [Longimicrobiales bacterium]